MFGIDWADSNCLLDPEGAKIATLSCIFPLFQNIINAAIVLSGTFAVFLIIFAGYKFIRSNGDPKQIDGARQIFLYAILGIFLVVFSFGIINIISYITGVDCIQKFGFTQCDPGALQPNSNSTQYGCYTPPNSSSPSCLPYNPDFTPVDGVWHPSQEACVNDSPCNVAG